MSCSINNNISQIIYYSIHLLYLLDDLLPNQNHQFSHDLLNLKKCWQVSDLGESFPLIKSNKIWYETVCIWITPQIEHQDWTLQYELVQPLTVAGQTSVYISMLDDDCQKSTRASIFISFVCLCLCICACVGLKWGVAELLIKTFHVFHSENILVFLNWLLFYPSLIY